MKKLNVIKCPHCGRKYLPGEIYLPDAFLGTPKDVFRDEKGDILGFDGNDMDLTETYVCDNCLKKFTVEASITFKTEAVKDIFSE